jgi:hypothetical protein
MANAINTIGVQHSITNPIRLIGVSFLARTAIHAIMPTLNIVVATITIRTSRYCSEVRKAAAIASRRLMLPSGHAAIDFQCKCVLNNPLGMLEFYVLMVTNAARRIARTRLVPTLPV